MEVSDQLHDPGRIIRRERAAGIRWMGGWVDLKCRFGFFKRTKYTKHGLVYEDDDDDDDNDNESFCEIYI
jgi:hypothetical protein